MQVTQKFIAQKANLSQKTVSQYFQGKARISPETRKNLEEIVNKYGYFPNIAARSIRTKRFNRISCLVISNAHDNNREALSPHLLTYLDAISSELSRQGYSMMIDPVRVDADRQVILNSPESLNSTSVDGIIGIVGGWIPQQVDDMIEKIKIPVVWINRQEPGLEYPMINYDEQPGIEQLIYYLAENEKKNIAWFGPDFRSLNSHSSAQTRYNLIVSILKKYNMELSFSAFNTKGQTLCPPALELFNQSPLPDVVISYNYHFKTAADQAAIYNNIRPNYDFESIHFASAWEFTPATYDLNTYVLLPEKQIGRTGAEYICKLINKDKIITSNKLSTSLHIGKSFKHNL